MKRLTTCSMTLLAILCLLLGFDGGNPATAAGLEHSGVYLSDLSIDPTASRIAAEEIRDLVALPARYDGKKFFVVGNLRGEIGQNAAFADNVLNIYVVDGAVRTSCGLVLQRKFLSKRSGETFMKKLEAQPFASRWPETYNLKPELNCTVWFTIASNQKFPIRIDRIKYPDGRIETRF
jgi:hypothetical protein